jgi:cytochrome b pre-mRNA-processing protein 3
MRGYGFDKAAAATMILALFRKDPRRSVADTLYRRVVEAALRPPLYLELGVPDTIEGRFEAVALHLVLVLRRLRGLPHPSEEIAQELVDGFFRHMDASMRETGVGDMRVPKRMKKLAAAFYGRAKAYDRVLDAADEDGLARELVHNVLDDRGSGLGLARYALEADRGLASQTLDRLLTDGPDFPTPLTTEEEPR